ncbi:PIN domain-containing protein [Dinoroseobacter sp. PD6]|uniref:RSP_2648 family PIN domain-containing protein n=1 Tax=Dinoroseobacter sp. PD6 TaxID=3028384 RepID=UPI00237AB9A2|nr:PIN domain-containing protein [Dinoroseobacter sp. PD6]MDD9715389.1 PIN domain-containing protein [Dinoroseobacter sp. PD6]
MTERVLLDACVLYPTLLRALLLSCARAGLFTPLWSPRILAEWSHAAARSGPDEAALVAGEIAILRTAFPDAEITAPNTLTDTLSLPDADDRHVLAAAVHGKADALLTANLKDFPTRTLTRHGLLRYEPDSFLCHLRAAPGTDALLLPQVQRSADVLGVTPRSVLKRARLPRLGKALFPG